MDELSRLSQGLGGTQGGDPSAALSGLTGAVQQEGGLDGLLGKLRQGGLGDQVDSWVSTGENQPVDPDQLGQALGPDTVQRLSAGSGLNIASLLPMLAAFLPQIINMLTPHGRVPSGGLDSSTGSAGTPDLGGLLGGLLAGAGGMGGPGGLSGLGGKSQSGLPGPDTTTDASSGTDGAADSGGLDGLSRGLGGDKGR